MPRKSKSKVTRKIGVIDFETDPFLFGRVPKPFCVEFYTDEITQQFWGHDCAEQLANYLEKLEEPHLIYAHNGGKFDFHFLFKYIDNPALVIKTRITECKIFHHTLRDSYSILPVPLRDYEKMEFEYWKMEEECRDKYRKPILEYLHSDCINLYNLVTAFIAEFGLQMTIGGTAMKEIQKHHDFLKSGAKHDELFRPWFYGGRVQRFVRGIMKGPFIIVDVNAMYMGAMKNYLHPINGSFRWSNKLPDNWDMPFFLTFRGTNNNAIPCYGEDGSLDFTKKEGIFKCCSHELKVALKHNLVTIDEVIECYISEEAINFETFVDKVNGNKEKNKKSGNKTGYLLWKTVGNSGYGRFTINPENFADWIIHRDFGNEEELIEKGYKQECDYETIELWSRPTNVRDDDYCDVAIGASITSAARSVLLQALQDTVDPLYCDTDSIICREFYGDMDPYRIGAWDLEKTTDNVAICEKKLYAMYDDGALELFKDTVSTNTSLLCSKCKLPFKNGRKHKEHQDVCNTKMASKGGQLSLAEIVAIASGDVVKYYNNAPTFSLKREPRFVSRTFQVNEPKPLDAT